MKHNLSSTSGVFYVHLLNFPKWIKKHKSLLALREAFSNLEIVLYPLKFQTSENATEAQISIEFDQEYTRHWRPSGSIAFATYPHTQNPWVIVMNGKHEWDYHSLMSVFTHEMAHTLGLRHSDDPNSPMYPRYRASRPVVFDRRDRKAFAILYRDQRHQRIRKLLDWTHILRLSEQDRMKSHQR